MAGSAVNRERMTTTEGTMFVEAEILETEVKVRMSWHQIRASPMQ